jgi:predicted Rossmann fold flavoprotein
MKGQTGGSASWDVVIIGGGPAGMMAAGRAAELGAKVLLVEKNESLGKKLLITGGGRCNVTNAEFDTHKFLAKFKKNDKFLFSPFSEFGVKETLDFFHSKNMPTKVEAELRAFPVSNKALSVWETLVNYMKKGGVTIYCNSPVTGFVKNGGVITAVRLKNGQEIRAKSFVLATGGKSRPETGSTGEGFSWLKSLGHTVIEPNAALVPIATNDPWVKRLQGVSLKEVKLTAFQNGVKQDAKKGKILFTHFGLSGPLVLNMSRDIGELLKYGEVTLSIDLFPSLDPGALDRKLRELLTKNSNKQFKNILSGLAPAAMAPVLIELSGVRPDTFNHSLTRAEREQFIKLLKNIPMYVAGLLGVNKAVVTSGGVALPEVDFKTMRSRRIHNLFLVGDVLNIDRPSGGYSLQLCWTTGYVAGTNVVN